MKKVSLQQVNQFVAATQIAIAGVSRTQKSFSANVVTHLTNKGYQLWLINPHFCYPGDNANQLQSLEQLPAGISHLLILTPPSQTYELVQQAIDRGIKHIWIQQQSETESAIELAIANGIQLIHHECIFMYTQPGGIHQLHRRMRQLFGMMPV